jgi:SapC protein
MGAMTAAQDSPAAPRPSAPETPPLPIFYRRPVMLAPELHFGMAYRAPGNYDFARDTNAIPLNVSEFSLAARHYPIVFADTDPIMPVAVVGVASKSRNLFVDDAGNWRAGVYIPAYVRRYPFIFLEDRKKKEFVLAIDEGAGLLVEREGPDDKLFRNGKPTPLVERALAFCSEFQANLNFTRQFCKAVEEEKLLSEKEAGMSLVDGRYFRLTGFRLIEEARFDKFPGKQLLKLRRRRFLHPIYLHLISTANWATILDLAAAQGE